MGFLDALKGKKPEVTITAEPSDLLPGQEVRVRVTIAGELDDKAEDGKAGLRCLNEYLVRERDHDHDDNRPREVWRSVQLHEQAIDVPLAIGDHDFTFVVPEGLPPASKQAVSWWAWANIDRRRGLDASASAKLAVRLPAGRVPARAPRLRDRPRRASRSPTRPPRPRAGETIEGTFTVTPPEGVKATAVRVRLTRTRTYTEDKIVKRDHFFETDLHGELELAPGQTQSFPFALQVPDEGPDGRDGPGDRGLADHGDRRAPDEGRPRGLRAAQRLRRLEACRA